MLMLSSSTVAANYHLSKPVLWILSGTYKAMMAVVDMASAWDHTKHFTDIVF